MWNSNETKINLNLIRHGKTKGNEEGRYIGFTDEALSEKGIKSLVKREYPKADVVFASPLNRCMETAKYIYDCDRPVIIEEFKEMNFGDFEGKNYRDLAENKDYQKWIDSMGKIPFPNGEGQEEFIKRVMSGYKKMMDIIGSDYLNECVDKKEINISCVVHGGTIMAVCSSLLDGKYYDYQLKNGEYISLENIQGSWKIK